MNNKFTIRERIIIKLTLWVIKFVGKNVDGCYTHQLDTIIYEAEKLEKESNNERQ